LKGEGSSLPFLLYNLRGREYAGGDAMLFEPVAKIRVRYAETDAMGVAYNANYLVWFELGRTEFCRGRGFPYTQWEAAGVFLPVVEARCRYKAPVRYDDLLEVQVGLSSLTRYTLAFSYRISRIEDGKLVAEGETRHGFCDGNGKLLKAPQPFYGWLEKVLNETEKEGVVEVG